MFFLTLIVASIEARNHNNLTTQKQKSEEVNLFCKCFKIITYQEHEGLSSLGCF